MGHATPRLGSVPTQVRSVVQAGVVLPFSGKPPGVKVAVACRPVVVLVDRGGRELPMHAAYSAARIALPKGQRLSLVRDEAGRFSFNIELSEVTP